MNIGVAYDGGQIAKNLGECRTFLIITAEGQNPTGKRLVTAEGASTTELLKLASMEKIDVLICGSLGLAMRNALENDRGQLLHNGISSFRLRKAACRSSHG